MRLHRPVALAFALAIALGLPATGAAEGEPRIGAVAERFPERSFVLTLPQPLQLDLNDVEVLENGEPVSGLRVAPSGSIAGGRVGFVLVIDASRSMRGAAIEAAMEAARAFVEERKPTQEIAIVTFSRGSNVLLPFTTDAVAIEAALAETPELAPQTRMYDAIDTALSLLEREKLAGSIIVLSDGADTSSVNRRDVTARAQAANVRIFTVGLRSRTFAPLALTLVAKESGGEYAEAQRPEDLEPIFASLGARLASEYLIRYRSNARPGTTVHVSVRVRDVDGIAMTEYSAPTGGTSASPAFHHSAIERLLRSAVGMVAASFVSAVLIALALLVLLRPQSRGLRRRLAEFVSVGLTEAGTGEAARHSPGLLSAAERSFEQARWWSRFKEELEIARIRVPPVHIVAWTVVGTVLAMWLLMLVGGSILYGLLGLGVPVVVRTVIKRRLERQRRLFADQLPDNLQVLASALRAGHSLVGALSVVVDDCPEPSRLELRRVLADERLGVRLEDAFDVVVRRMKNRDLEQVALVAALQRDTGGNTAEVLDRVAETVRARFELRRLVKTLTTQGRMSRWVVSLLPVALLGLITFLSPGYMEPMFVNPLGRVLLALGAIMVVAGSVVIGRIVNIKV
jgi:tight adherence protein B